MIGTIILCFVFVGMLSLLLYFMGFPFKKDK